MRPAIKTLFGLALAAALLSSRTGSDAQAAFQEPGAKKDLTPPVADPLACETTQSDACLRDVFFVSPQRGWAVGDRGAIWHTRDGGKEWTLQRAGVSCRLEAVCFATPDVGWAAGGYPEPYLQGGTGVVLTTQDGGETWVRDQRPRIPWIKRAGLFHPRGGWALGGTSGLYPSGAYHTESFGAEWVAFSGTHAGGWVAGDFSNPAEGALADLDGNFAVVRQGRLAAASGPQLGLRRVRRVQLSPGGKGWLVGQGGLVLWTGNGGATWQPPHQALPEELARHFDFEALAVRGPNVWIAGTPGTRIFYSPDEGQTWFAASTGQALPIRALCFADERHGYAVGSLGTILATTDGGQTWVRQRAGGTRCAVLGFFARPGDIPFELLARVAGNDGYLTAVEVVCRDELGSPLDERSSFADRVAEAVLRAGGSEAGMAWQFPLHPSGVGLGKAQTVALWDAANGGHGLKELEGWVVGRIRMWRPNVIVLWEFSAGAGRAEGALIQQAVLRAVSQAADHRAFPYHSERMGLPVWQVQSVYAALPASARGAVVVPASQLADRLGSSVGEVAEDARTLINDCYRPGPESLAFELLWEHGSVQRVGRELLSGLSEPPGSEARRGLLFPHPQTVERIRRLSQKRRTAEMLLERAQRDPRLAAALASEAEAWLAGLDRDSAAELLDRIAQRAWQAGRFFLAAELDELLARRFPDHALGRAAMLRLITHYGSAEIWVAARGAERDGVVQASTFPPAGPPVDRQAQLQRAVSLAAVLEQHHPDLFAAPRVALVLAAVQRQLRQGALADRLLEPLRHRTSRDLWWACAQSERWLTECRGLPPRPVLRCAAGSSPPRLDGRLDDSVWQSAAAVPLCSSLGEDGAWPATVLLAADGRFLYWAIRAHWAGPPQLEKPSGPRPRDGDLSAYDRVELLVDVDRDLATWFRLSIDSRAWTSEDCCGDRRWDPVWYVAGGRDEGAWTAEAAIPLDQFGKVPKRGDAWAVGIQRTIPGVGFQSWTAPAAAGVVAEGFGYLRFE